jgi:alpha-L-fucosidase
MRIPAILLLLLAVATSSYSQTQYTPSPENLKNREWFQNAKFGLFIHWGVYSVLGDGEWVMNVQEIPIRLYEKLPPMFNPTGYDPKA